MAGPFEDREIASVDYVRAQRAAALDELPEMRIQLGRAAGDVERADARSLEVAQHRVHRLPVHLLGARGTRVDVAVHAGLVAFVAEVDLERLETLAAYRGKVRDLEERERRVHGAVFLFTFARACRPSSRAKRDTFRRPRWAPARAAFPSCRSSD